MGASIGWMYASVVPDAVETLISIDQVKPLTMTTQEAAVHYGTTLASYLEAEKKYKTQQPSFRFETALDILIMAHEGFGVKITREGALCLLKRATKTSPDGSGLVFTRDVRLNTLLGQYVPPETLCHFYSGMKCNMLIVIGKDGINDFTNAGIKLVYDDHKARTEKYGGVFKSVTLEGDHFVHLTNPEKVAQDVKDYMNTVLLNSKTKDLSISK